ncbi:ATP-binding protein [Aeromonas dhakensis]|uniref:ATP-binding protein n=2 Tax=Aeromonas dhakensis TaxID=196024 RepID=UPI002B4949D8|nr:ATP-binding protein [Aeromonas dhakensis]
MAQSNNTSKPGESHIGSAKSSSATLRSTSGAGFEFEDLISAWQLVKALSGEQAPGISGVVTQVQAQVSTLGWYIDDLLLTAQATTTLCRLAISVKGNLQVTAVGLPADFVMRAWEQWRDPQGPFNRTTDGLALVTQGTHQEFDPVWREVKNACSGTDTTLTISRIRRNKKQSRVFDSVQTPGSASDEETIELIRHLHVLPTDFQFAHSETKAQAIAQCRRLLVSGSDDEAQTLWKELINVAKEVRLRNGTITVQGLLSLLRGQFGLRHHPDFEHDWETLSCITADHKARIETELPSGYTVPRTAEKALLQATVADTSVTVVFGESGSGKSALVKSVLDGAYPSWNQVWFGPEDLKTALSAARRGALPLMHELSRVLNATVKPQNVLVIDSAERIEASEFVVIRQLLQAILPNDGGETEGAWRIVIVTQTQSWVEGEETILRRWRVNLVEVEALKSDAVKLALLPSPTLGWLAAHDDTIAALTNLRTLAWVIKAGAAIRSNADGLASHTAIADSLWKHWTDDRADVQALMMRLAHREALFERSFALTDLEPADTATFTQRPDKLPLSLSERTNRIEFEHDLAADWARFQFLKQIWTDTPKWAVLASNPLWTNALRMLGQFLLRQQTETGTAWDIAFGAAEAAKNELAGDILLDALCLDPYAERFLNERVDLLLANGAAHFTRLLLRFHHIATVPTGGGIGQSTAVGLYMEAQYRSIVFGRWPPVLRFLIAQRERLAGLVSSALAKVIQTWLTKTPNTLSNGNPMPFRREMAEMALSMARTVQVEKGQGVIYLMRELLLFTAPLAGALDLPTEVGNWALELAGRRETDVDVKRRIAKVQLQKAKENAERLNTDAKYKVRHEARKQMPLHLGSFHERLPPWPLGAFDKVDMDFRAACIKENGIQSLMRAQPELAAEVLLALIIEDQPEREVGFAREMNLGLEYAEGTYPTAFWKSPFFPFFQLAPETALTSLIALVNFCTERWVAEVMKGRTGGAPGVTLQLADGSEKTFPGWWQVFDWPQSNDSMRNGNLFCALDALERWLMLRLDAGEDITADIEKILGEGNSAALVSALLNVAKYRPSLLTGPLSALLTFPDLFYWDSIRVKQVGHNFIAGSWLRSGEAMFNFAHDWTLAPHRQQKFLDIVVKLLLVDDDVARRLKALLPIWVLPEDPKEALEFKLIFATLDRVNYRSVTDSATGAETQCFVCPDELSREVQSWQADCAPAIAYLLVPNQCEQRLRGGQPLTNDEAAYLFNLLQECEAGEEGEDEDAKSNCRFAAAATLVTLGGAWLSQNPEAQKLVFQVVRAGVAAVASTGEDIRGRRMGSLRNELEFVAYAVMHLWLADEDGVQEWETAVMRLLTSGDKRAAAVVVGVAYANREQLGTTWWRLLHAGLFWSGLILLAPRHGDDNAADRAWKVWLTRLRRFPLRGLNATPDDLDFKRVVAGRRRLDFLRRMRLYNAGDQTRRGNPERERGGSLDGHSLEVLFNWLIEGDGTGDRDLDTRLALRIWDYEIARARASEKNEYGEYDLPSQNLGYDILLKLGALSIAAAEGEARAVWEPILSHGPAAHYALQHFIRGLFLRLGKGDDPVAFERVWRATAEYGLAADWSQPGLWFYGESLICDLLGFGSEDALSRLNPGTALRMKDIYERWAATHLAHDEECVTRFCQFLTTNFGAPLRLDGLRWLAATLKEREPSGRWYREGTGDALVDLVASALSQALLQDAQARQALVEITATLVANNTPTALALQERIKQLR